MYPESEKVVYRASYCVGFSQRFGRRSFSTDTPVPANNRGRWYIRVTMLLVIPLTMVFVMLATAVWGSFVDGTIHRPPSERAASVYVGFLVGLLAYAGMFLDFIRAHLLVAVVVGVAAFALLIGFTTMLWRRVSQWDDAYYARRKRIERP